MPQSTDKNPRYYTHPHWSSNNIKDSIDEIITKDNVDVKYLSKKDHLNPEIWLDEDTLHSDVRKAMLGNALEFIKFAKIDKLKYDDIIMTGSLANYNWTEYSDIDIHILMNFTQISEDEELVADIMKTKKSLWENKIDSTIHGFDVELYVQNTNEEHVSTGVYSLMNEKWIKKPIKQIVTINLADIQLKSADIMNQIDELLETNNHINALDNAIKLFDKIKKYRQIGLDRDGEYASENLVFKVLRNNGYLTKLAKEKDKLLSKKLTLDEINTHLTEDSKIVPNKPIKHNKSIALMTMLINTFGVDYLTSFGANKELINKAKPYLDNVIKSSKNEI